MAQLVSPGLSITVTDESQYLPTAVGTVPFILLATSENKLFNDVIADGTRKENANKLIAVTSQRDLVTFFGYPEFKTTTAGTPIHASELNEYGLMAAYSAMGMANRAFVMRADIDLAQLNGTSVRPISPPENGTYWLDLTETAWGVYQWDANTQEFVNYKPTVITKESDTITNVGLVMPKESFGTVGSYAIVALNNNNALYYKRYDNVWTWVGTTEWQKSFPTVVGDASNPVLTPSSQVMINTVTVIIPGTTVQLAASAINSANIPGVTARENSIGKLEIFATSAAASNGSIADGLVTIVDGTNNPLVELGITAGTYASPATSFGDYVQIPDWRVTDTVPRPTGSIWIKMSAIGNGNNMSVKSYNAETDAWSQLATPVYERESEAIAEMDPAAGGMGIAPGTVYIKTGRLGVNSQGVTFKPYVREIQGELKMSGDVPISPMVFNIGDTFSLFSTDLNEAVSIETIVTIGGTNAEAFVASVLAANIPHVQASVDITGAITFTHALGGTIGFKNVTGTPLTTAGFNSTTDGIEFSPLTGYITLSNFGPLVYTYSTSQPFQAPADGTMWYYNSPLDNDIMINDFGGWKGYKNVSSDARGYNLTQTDPNGPILSPVAPKTQSDATALVPGDVWIDTGDLENFPKIYRWTATNQWKLVDNADRFTQNGIVFADARWDTSGTVDPTMGDFPSIPEMQKSNYVDLDCPDYRLYPRGTLLFNLRRSGFNIKKYVSNYFNEDAFPNKTLPEVKTTWVTASGLMNNGAPYTGRKAQRNMVVKAMRGALDASDTIREESFQFNLMVTPAYPELISNMVMLNNDRKNTAFIIGDTPMSMKSDVISFTDWSQNRNGDGLSTADPYLAVYYPSALTNDLQGNTIVVPPSHVALRTFIRNDQVSYPWFAPAGARRGLVDNAIDVGYVDLKTGSFMRDALNQGKRDALYTLNINPITILPSVGLVVWGQKTRNPFASSMDRVNVARLVNYIRTILAHVADGYLFEPNDAQTRNEFKAVVESGFNDLIAKRGIYDFLVVCDETNNTPDRIARNELYCDVAIEPMRAVEFVYIPIRLKNPGAIAAGN
jgi:hypothetical protein